MHWLLTGFGVLVLVVGLIAPFGLALTRIGFVAGLLASVVAVVALTIAYAWWDNFSVDLEALWMGVDLDGVTTTERMRDVAPEHRDYAEGLVFSPRRLGIGWPVKALFALAITVPYAGICFSGTRLIRRTLARP